MHIYMHNLFSFIVLFLLGNNPCYPYDACVATHMGDDVDVLTWEQVIDFLFLKITYQN